MLYITTKRCMQITRLHGITCALSPSSSHNKRSPTRFRNEMPSIEAFSRLYYQLLAFECTFMPITKFNTYMYNLIYETAKCVVGVPISPSSFSHHSLMARSESSAASTLVQPVRRFDLLISEHVSTGSLFILTISRTRTIANSSENCPRVCAASFGSFGKRKLRGGLHCLCVHMPTTNNPSIRTQDEKRAAKLQVQSLLQRADELVLTLKVKYHFSLDIPFTQCTCHRMQLATEVRKELAHAYKDISEAKEKNLQVSTDKNMSRPRA